MAKYRNQNQQNHRKQKTKKKDKKAKILPLRTSASDPLQIDWLLSSYRFLAKLPNTKKLRCLNLNKAFDANKILEIDFKLGMTICPGKTQTKHAWQWQRDLHADLDLIKQHKVDIVVTLLSKRDIERLQIDSIFHEIRNRGMEWVWYDIADGTLPSDVELWKQYVAYIGGALTKENKTVLVHCMGGLCRTGAFILSVLKYLKLINKQSIGQGVVWIGNSRKSAGGTCKQIQFVQNLTF